MESLSSFLDLLYTIKMKLNSDDIMCWQPALQKGFKVSSYYRVLSSRDDSSFPWKSIWKPKVPSRVAFFVWAASLGKILTADNLRNRNIILVSWCCLCKADGETVDHLLLHCSFSRELWNMILALFGVQWVMPCTVLDLLACWQGSFGKHRHVELWRGYKVPLTWLLISQEIARQLCAEHQLLFSKMASFDDNSQFMIAMLRECGLAHKTIIFVLDEFDLFAQGKQRVLYSLLDAMQSVTSQAVVIGVSCRLDADQLLEKRVRSRFSHRKLLFLPPSKEDLQRLLEHILSLPVDSTLPHDYAVEFNSKLQVSF
uniref:Reverse transcriptase zinc-binding domain-containing protein n=1 Tax=Fagus sylvatica TaxID=28930 RepID=A0A2N9IDI8_FAGSY